MAIPYIDIGGTPVAEGQFVAAKGIDALYDENRRTAELLCEDMRANIRYWSASPTTQTPDMMIADDGTTFMVWIAGTTNKLQLAWQTAGSIVPVPIPIGAGLENPAFYGWGAELYAVIAPFLQNRDWRNIQISGHSLGGACACCVAERIAMSNHDRIKTDVMTFGQPKNWIEGSVIPLWRSYSRIEHYQDPVQFLPPNLTIGLGVGRALSLIKRALTLMHITRTGPGLKWHHFGRLFKIGGSYSNRGGQTLVLRERSEVDEERVMNTIFDETGLQMTMGGLATQYHDMKTIYLDNAINQVDPLFLVRKYGNLGFGRVNGELQSTNQSGSITALPDIPTAMRGFSNEMRTGLIGRVSGRRY